MRTILPFRFMGPQFRTTTQITFAFPSYFGHPQLVRRMAYTAAGGCKTAWHAYTQAPPFYIAFGSILSPDTLVLRCSYFYIQSGAY
jgi:hypothetical protein